MVTSPPLYNPGELSKIVDDWVRTVEEPHFSTITTPKWTFLYSTENSPAQLYDIENDPKKSQEVTIRYANWLTVDEEETERAVLEEFARENPDIKIDFQPMPWTDYERAMVTKFAVETVPEVFNIAKLPQWADSGQLLVLDDLIAEDSSLDMDDFFPLRGKEK